jgi:outer membrane protein assembly factor BamE (lipoprotein component of BamABCDE complex)
MGYRSLLTAAILAGGLANAATVAVDNGIAVKQSDVAMPARGMTMDQVTAKFGAPVNKIPAVGKPPISRWEYPGFIVYFESDHVITSVVPNSAPPDSATPDSATPNS